MPFSLAFILEITSRFTLVNSHEERTANVRPEGCSTEMKRPAYNRLCLCTSTWSRSCKCPCQATCIPEMEQTLRKSLTEDSSIGLLSTLEAS